MKGGREAIDGEVLGCGCLGEREVLEPMSRASVLLPLSFRKVPSHPAADVLEAGEMDIVCNEVLGFTPTLWEFSSFVGRSTNELSDAKSF